jgi:elongation factor P--(R)-beta-lysine ligase
LKSSGQNWRPVASLERLRQRATALATARRFFNDRGYLEIETPAIVARPVSDPQLANIRCRMRLQYEQEFFLHTSPEYHMKRALAAGSGNIFQICKAYRDGELGRRHLPEFTLAEWYRCGVAYGAFIDETLELIEAIAASLRVRVTAVRRLSYAEAFTEFAAVDPLVAAVGELRHAAVARLGAPNVEPLLNALGENRDAWLDLILSSIVEPALASLGLVVVDRYPASQAALARLDAGDPRVAERFEIYLHGMELANGYHELADVAEQSARFGMDQVRRGELGAPVVAADDALLAALAAGLPDCCGVALGFDRLLMACLGETDIRRVVAFVTPDSA